MDKGEVIKVIGNFCKKMILSEFPDVEEDTRAKYTIQMLWQNVDGLSDTLGTHLPEVLKQLAPSYNLCPSTLLTAILNDRIEYCDETGALSDLNKLIADHIVGARVTLRMQLDDPHWKSLEVHSRLRCVLANTLENLDGKESFIHWVSRNNIHMKGKDRVSDSDEEFLKWATELTDKHSVEALPAAGNVIGVSF